MRAKQSAVKLRLSSSLDFFLHVPIKNFSLSSTIVVLSIQTEKKRLFGVRLMQASCLKRAHMKVMTDL